jgi:hypothetical protein
MTRATARPAVRPAVRPAGRETRAATRPAPAPAAVDDRSRVLTRATLRAAELLDLNGARLAATLGVSEAGVSRLAAGTRAIDPTSKEGELAALLVRCFRSLDALVGGDDAQRRAWMAAPNRALNGVPRDRIETVQGLVATVAYLDGMRAPL